MVLLFDAANTLIHKPQIFTSTQAILRSYGYNIPLEYLQKQHRFISEVIIFPDKTNKTFYQEFNNAWLLSVGVIPNQEILEEIFSACSYLPWLKFDDTEILSKIDLKKGVISNFHSGLTSILDVMFPNTFNSIAISEQEQYRKPDIGFYRQVIERLNVKPREIVYIGDSLKLDLKPALEAGLNAFLIDRSCDFPYCNRRLDSLNQLQEIL